MSVDPSEPRPSHSASPSEAHPVVEEELAQLDRVRTALLAAWERLRRGAATGARGLGDPRGSGSGAPNHYDADLVELRDELAEAKPEDIAPLAEQMMRVAAIRAARGAGSQGDLPADPSSPYFGHLRLREAGRARDVFVGKRSYIDARRGVTIVDWREAPISALYYRYEEGDDYEEEIAGRSREGVIEVRRTLSVVGGELQRVRCPQGLFVRESAGPGDRPQFRRVAESAAALRGGQGKAARPKGASLVRRRGGVRGRGRRRIPGVRPDKHLPEISALLDAVQFGLICDARAGLLVVSGGAGSGKTTIGLHRVAFLAYQNPAEYRPERMLVLVPGRALATYISRVLPDLGLPGVPVRTVPDWLAAQRRRFLNPRHVRSAPDPEGAVTRVKMHPDLARLIEDRVAELRTGLQRTLEAATAGLAGADAVRRTWARCSAEPGALAQQVASFLAALELQSGGPDAAVPPRTLAAVRATLSRVRPRPQDAVTAWAELLTDRQALGTLGRGCGQSVGEETVREAVSVIARQVEAVREAAEAGDGAGGHRRDPEDPVPVDGENPEEVGDTPWLSPQDDAVLLRFYQRLVGPLTGRSRKPLRYAHLFLDEVQDLSVVALAAILDATGPQGSVTLAGDLAQRMVFDTGYDDWETLLRALHRGAETVAPLQIGYRSTAEIAEFARGVLGGLAPESATRAARSGVPVEAFHFAEVGEAVAFLAESLRELVRAEPLASVALVARHRSQALAYYRALRTAEVPGLRLVTEQDFRFSAGIEVTDVRQVKGLEFDYVVLLDVTAESYPDTTEARHLLHIAATRAAHQLWVLVPGRPSPILEALESDATEVASEEDPEAAGTGECSR